MGRGDSMILTFQVPPLASGQEKNDIDRVKPIFSQILTTQIIGLISRRKHFPIFRNFLSNFELY